METDDTKPDRPLSARELRFCAEYVIDRCGSAAYQRAGFGAKTPAVAKACASRLLSRPDVGAEIDRLEAELAADARLRAHEVYQEIARVAFSDIRHFHLTDLGNVQLAEGAPPDAMKAIASIKRKVRRLNGSGIEYEVEVKFWDKIGALRMAGQTLKLFTDKAELTGPNGQPLPPVKIITITMRSDCEEAE
jgi:phage terminase small subunit